MHRGGPSVTTPLCLVSPSLEFFLPSYSAVGHIASSNIGRKPHTRAPSSCYTVEGSEGSWVAAQRPNTRTQMQLSPIRAQLSVGISTELVLYFCKDIISLHMHDISHQCLHTRCWRCLQDSVIFLSGLPCLFLCCLSTISSRSEDTNSSGAQSIRRVDQMLIQRTHSCSRQLRFGKLSSSLICFRWHSPSGFSVSFLHHDGR